MRTYKLGSPEAMRLEPPLDPPDGGESELTDDERRYVEELIAEQAAEYREDARRDREEEAGWGGSNYP